MFVIEKQCHAFPDLMSMIGLDFNIFLPNVSANASLRRYRLQLMRRSFASTTALISIHNDGHFVNMKMKD